MASGGSTAHSHQSSLRLVEGPLDEHVPWAWFCGRCAAPPQGGEAPAPIARVCPACNMGLLLEARSDAVPSAEQAFVLVDSDLLVQGLSKQAEELLALEEAASINRPLSELFLPADADEGSRATFFVAVADAIARGGPPTHRFVRPWNTYGVRVRVRIAACGPPRAALLVLGV